MYTYVDAHAFLRFEIMTAQFTGIFTNCIRSEMLTYIPL